MSKRAKESARARSRRRETRAIERKRETENDGERDSKKERCSPPRHYFRLPLPQLYCYFFFFCCFFFFGHVLLLLSYSARFTSLRRSRRVTVCLRILLLLVLSSLREKIPFLVRFVYLQSNSFFLLLLEFLYPRVATVLLRF